LCYLFFVNFADFRIYGRNCTENGPYARIQVLAKCVGPVSTMYDKTVKYTVYSNDRVYVHYEFCVYCIKLD
jgi:hypothetical protein